MSVSRRDFLTLLGLGMLAAGCTPEREASYSRPGPLWPNAGQPGAGPSPRPHWLPPAAKAAPTPVRPPAQPAAVGSLPIQAIPRSSWADGGPIVSRLNPMGRVTRITVHHEGWQTVDFSDAARTAERLEKIRRSHLDRFTAGDIGYHFIIDRAGRVWQGRDLRYQGAHVKAANEQNVGVMVLGNFDQQSPTAAQLETLQKTLGSLMKHYRVPVARVYTHQELAPTACPGKSLQPRVVAVRRALV